MKNFVRKSSLVFIIAIVLTGCQQPKGVVEADEWEKFFPEIVETYHRNSLQVETTYGGSAHVDYLEAYPYLKKFYAGYAFEHQYDRLKGHTYALEDVENTLRPKAAASCYACKSSDYVEMLNTHGTGYAAIPFHEAKPDMYHTITCYDCHQNHIARPGVNRDHLINAFDPALPLNPTESPELVCAQCHVEYYLDPDSKVVILPWELGLGADEAYQYYEKLGYADWIHPTTGTPLLKAQHPEYETFKGSVHEAAGATCIDCHMPYTKIRGTEVRSHHWTSPMLTLTQSCSQCHAESEEMMIVKVETLQKDIYEKTQNTALAIEELIDKLTLAVESGKYTDAELDAIRALHREAQFKWDYVFVENSEGFHNHAKADSWLEEANSLAQQALILLNKPL